MNNTNKFTAVATCLVVAGGVAVDASWAQVAPDAGTNLEMLRRQPQPLPPGPSVAIPERSPFRLQGGQTTQIRSIQLQGNTHLSTESVLSAIGADAAIQQPLNIDGLRDLSDRVTRHHQANGFPFARALLPVQDLKDGLLIIQVVEGQYGKVQAKSSDTALAEAAQGVLALLERGQTIESAPLERATLLISDWPGVSVVPVMKPGAQTGEGDLDVLVEQVQTTTASLSIDNHGSRYTGPVRTQFNGAINRVLTEGDQISLTGIMPVQGLWVGSLNYALPLGSDGWRVQAGVSRMHYKLREDFDGFNGLADVRSLTLSYPVIRSRAFNLTTSAAYQYKELKDVSTFQTTTKKADVYPLTLAFDARDSWVAGGLTYGAISAVSGQLNTGSTASQFTKWTVDVARIQQLGQGWSLYGRWFQQITADNLDSSEKALLGGASGVRAYPSGEAAGDRAQVLQAEVRWSEGGWSPYMFYDHGKVQVDARPELVNLPTADKTRAGGGVGVRFQQGPLSVNIAAAWRGRGQPVPEVDTKTSGSPRIWAEARYAF